MDTTKSILIIDDDEYIRESLRTLLGAKGQYRVTTASDGQAGLVAALSNPPDLIILDIIMPGMDGFDVLKELKESDATSSIPVIMLTAAADSESIRKATYEYSAHYLVKPYDIDVLHSTVAHVLALKKEE